MKSFAWCEVGVERGRRPGRPRRH